jgi:hypothetical protein
MSKHVAIVLVLIVTGLLAGIAPALAQGDGEELTETFVTTDGSISLKYPAGWAIDSPYMADMIIFSNDPAGLETDDESIAAGSVLVYLFGPQSSSMVFSGDLPASLDDAVEMIVQMAEDSEGDGTPMPDLSAPAALTLGEYAAVRIGVSTADAEGSMILIDFGGKFGIASITVAPGELPKFEATVMAVLDTLVYAAPTGPLTFTNDNGTLSLEYPPEWVALDMQIVAVATSYDAIQFENTEPAAPGSVMIFVYPPDIFSTLIAEAQDLKGVASLLAQYWVPDFDPEKLGTPDGAPLAFVKFGEREAVRIDFTTATDQGYAFALDIDGQIVAVLVRAAVGELEDQDAAIMSIVDSIQYTPEAETTTP